ncbi:MULTISPECIES: HyaD/HybD family hydrogenase maturation endopeptidase [Pelosinus]|uniref:Hydrogenase expression/formation protein n=1 Tax=Pelosinus fermentans B4 TaxID=1149862 RepID=I9AWF6_9FIRM|nr:MULTISPECIES: HyaD/HybD family hydrogenase maturation endopeptidase [Pelosinus]EIW17237.1 hydrogenase expression/formation protein [Pelosinus fermentans B4]EIW22964.1 hydrogenase expression/formation protein [Pelosinus fermentans A11]OAM93995.1 hydrogenase expression/formation protein [Pelosinus fermentans DSM 17108]SDQ96632.1 hydrogenase maturation protease [Pelosinus fermentans]
MKQITVLGVGNILMQDEGFGVRVVEQLLKQYSFPQNVQILDGGTLGMELLRFLIETDKLILVDAVAGSLPPGSLYHFQNNEVKAYFKEKVSMHELGIQDVLAILDVMEKPVQEIRILGVQPLTVDIGLEMTPIVAEKVDVIIEQILLVLHEWQVEVVKFDE